VFALLTTPKSPKGDLSQLQSIAMFAIKAPSGVWGEKKDNNINFTELIIFRMKDCATIYDKVCIDTI